eukprot:scaffold7351_cov259-Pinguiococcus_pyrenoidosus.AAC.4
MPVSSGLRRSLRPQGLVPFEGCGETETYRFRRGRQVELEPLRGLLRHGAKHRGRGKARHRATAHRESLQHRRDWIPMASAAACIRRQCGVVVGASQSCETVVLV